MTTLADLAPVFKGFGCGRPKTGKTGSLASLINTGLYNVRIISLDANLAPLLTYVEPEMLDKVEVVKFKEDYYCDADGALQFKTPPKMFAKVNGLLFNWKYKDAAGNEIDHGHVRTWTSKDLLVIDQNTALCRAAMNNTLKIQDRLTRGPRLRDYGLAQHAIDTCMELLASDDVPCNVFVLSHVQMVGPPESKDDDDDDVKEAKRRMAQIIPFRLYPKAIGQAQPPYIGGHFPYMLYYNTRKVGGVTKRVIECHAREDFDISVPLEGVPKELDISDGLAKIFAAVRGEKPW